MKRIFVLFLCFLVPSPGFASLLLSDLPARVTPRNEYYSIDSVEDAHEPGISKFHVACSHDFYAVEGFLPLVKLLHEIEVIEKIKRDEKGSGFFDGASASVEATAQGLGNLVTHPVKSVQGLGAAAGKLGRGIGGVFRKKETGEKSSFGEKVLGANKRELAKQFNVDVYSTNPTLQDLLSKMARARMGGKGAVFVIQLLVPVAALASLAITAGSINGAADQLVNDSDRSELYRLNKKALLEMGFAEGVAQGILNLKYFSPREQTYFRFYLQQLKKTEGYQEIARSILGVGSEWQVRKKLYAAQMAADLSQKKELVRMRNFDEGLAAQDKQGNLYFFAPYDELGDSKPGKKILKHLQQLKSELHPSSIEIRNGGKISGSFQARAQQEGISTKSWIFLEDAG